MKSVCGFFLSIIFSEMIGSVCICRPLRAPLVKHTWLTCCLSALPLALRVHSSVSAQEGTRGTPNLEITRAGPREAQSLQGHLRARGRVVSLIRSRVKRHSLLNTTVTPVSRYFELFGSRARAYPPHRHQH